MLNGAMKTKKIREIISTLILLGIFVWIIIYNFNRLFNPPKLPRGLQKYYEAFPPPPEESINLGRYN